LPTQSREEKTIQRNEQTGKKKESHARKSRRQGGIRESLVCLGAAGQETKEEEGKSAHKAKAGRGREGGRKNCYPK